MVNNLWLNPLFWLSFYLVGYVIAILMLAIFGIEKIKDKIPQWFLRVFIFLIFVLPPIVFPFTKSPRMAIPLIVTGIFLIVISFIIRIVSQKQIEHHQF